MANIPWARAPGSEAYYRAYAQPGAFASFLGGAVSGFETGREIAEREIERRRRRREFEAKLAETKRGRMATEGLRTEIAKGREEEKERERKWQEEQKKEQRQHEMKMAKILHGYRLLEKKAKDIEKMEKEELKKKFDRILGRAIKRYKGKPDKFEEYMESYFEIFPGLREVGRIPSRYLKEKRLTEEQELQAEIKARESITPKEKMQLGYTPGGISGEVRERTAREKLRIKEETPATITTEEQEYLTSLEAPTEQELAILTKAQTDAYNAAIKQGKDPRDAYNKIKLATPEQLAKYGFR